MWLAVAALLWSAAAEPPTRNGDPVGEATLARDGTLTMQLRSVECDGTIVEGSFAYRPADGEYRSMLGWVGTIGAGETKTLRARDLAPCRVGLPSRAGKR